MRILIEKTALLAQIDSQSQGSDLPARLILEGCTVEKEQFIDALQKEYPKLYADLTYTERVIMSELFAHIGQEVRYSALFAAFQNSKSFRSSYENANKLSVHVKNIRGKLRKHNAPLEIRTTRAGVRSSIGVSGAYMLVSV